MIYEVFGVDKDTGEAREIVVDAISEQHAEALAGKRNVLVSRCLPVCTSGTKDPAAGLDPVEPEGKQCVHCNEWIHSEAARCPHCQSGQKSPAWAVLMAAVLLIGVASWSYRSYAPLYGSAAAKEARDRHEDKVKAWATAQRCVRARLESPASADFGGTSDQTADQCVTDLGGGLFKAEGWVDTRSRLGTKQRTRFTCTVKHLGNDKWQCDLGE